jgi:hypothetical protein
MKTLHYGALPLGSEIEQIEFDTARELSSYLFDKADKSKKLVYIITFNMGDDCSSCPIFIEEDATALLSLMFVHGDFYEEFVDTFFLQEYESYEDAYKVAMDMREPNPLCYDKELIAD